MTDRPIPFQPPMVRALLDGRKTQTRRLLKPQPNASGKFDDIKSAKRALRIVTGDRLWVREAWRTDSGFDHLSGKQIETACIAAGYKRAWAPMAYSDGTVVNWREDHGLGRYRHARFMSRWASRITLLVTAVRVQRLQDISEEDAIAEGVYPAAVYGGRVHSWLPTPGHRNEFYPDGRKAYVALWNSINAKPGTTWADNPWVAAYTFTVHRCNIDAMAEAA